MPERTNRRVLFTARSVAALRPQPGQTSAIDWVDLDCPGLTLRVSPGGTKAWNFLYKIAAGTLPNGHPRWKGRRVKLGNYPAVDLAAARKLALTDRCAVQTTDADPAAARQAKRRLVTVAELCDLYMKVHAKLKKRTWARDQQRINRHITPAWGTRAVTTIERTDVHALLDHIVTDHGGTEANRVKSLISKIWTIAVDRGHAKVHVCYRMAKPTRDKARETIVDDARLRALWNGLDKHEPRASLHWRPDDAIDATRLRLLTAQRGGIVFGMEWREMDFHARLWTIDGSKMKNGLPHIVPLTDGAIEILTRRHAGRDKKDPLVFKGMYHQRNDVRALATLHGGEYRWHDFRRTFRTHMAAIGVPKEVCSHVLSHYKKDGDVTDSVYNAHQYKDEKRAALNLWAANVARAARGEAPGPPDSLAYVHELHRIQLAAHAAFTTRHATA